jgi:hypothetical protein
MMALEAEMSFDTWKGDKVRPPGGAQILCIEDREVSHATKQDRKRISAIVL